MNMLIVRHSKNGFANFSSDFLVYSNVNRIKYNNLTEKIIII